MNHKDVSSTLMQDADKLKKEIKEKERKIKKNKEK